jgi:hypothetical protein
MIANAGCLPEVVIDMKPLGDHLTGPYRHDLQALVQARLDLRRSAT